MLQAIFKPLSSFIEEEPEICTLYIPPLGAVRSAESFVYYNFKTYALRTNKEVKASDKNYSTLCVQKMCTEIGVDKKIKREREMERQRQRDETHVTGIQHSL